MEKAPEIHAVTAGPEARGLGAGAQRSLLHLPCREKQSKSFPCYGKNDASGHPSCAPSRCAMWGHFGGHGGRFGC